MPDKKTPPVLTSSPLTAEGQANAAKARAFFANGSEQKAEQEQKKLREEKGILPPPLSPIAFHVPPLSLPLTPPASPLASRVTPKAKTPPPPPAAPEAEVKVFAEAEVQIRARHLAQSYVVTAGTDYNVKTGDEKKAGNSTWLAEGVLSVHLPSKDPLDYFKMLLTAIEPEITKLKAAGGLLTIQGDFNVNFADPVELEKFEKILTNAGFSIESVNTPDHNILKMRGLLCQNAQPTKANDPSRALKDISITLNLTKNTFKNARQHYPAVMKLKDLESIKKDLSYPEEIPTDHSVVYVKIEDKLYATLNVIPSVIKTKNFLYDPKNTENVKQASNAFSNFRWRFFATELLKEEGCKALFAGLNFDTIDFNSIDKKYMVKGKELTGVELRKTLEKALQAATKARSWGYSEAEANKENPAVQKDCQDFARKFYTEAYKSAEFKAYDALFYPDKQYNAEKIAQVMACNVDNLDCIKEYISGSSPFKMMTFMAMGAIKDVKKDRTHDDFDYPICWQPNNGFAASLLPTQEAIDIEQARYFLNELRRQEDAPIAAVELLECPAGKDHSKILYVLIEQIVQLSHIRKLQDIQFDDLVGPARQVAAEREAVEREAAEKAKADEEWSLIQEIYAEVYKKLEARNPVLLQISNERSRQLDLETKTYFEGQCLDKWRAKAISTQGVVDELVSNYESRLKAVLKEEMWGPVQKIYAAVYKKLAQNSFAFAVSNELSKQISEEMRLHFDAHYFDKLCAQSISKEDAIDALVSFYNHRITEVKKRGRVGPPPPPPVFPVLGDAGVDDDIDRKHNDEGARIDSDADAASLSGHWSSSSDDDESSDAVLMEILKALQPKYNARGVDLGDYIEVIRKSCDVLELRTEAGDALTDAEAMTFIENDLETAISERQKKAREEAEAVKAVEAARAAEAKAEAAKKAQVTAAVAKPVPVAQIPAGQRPAVKAAIRTMWN